MPMLKLSLLGRPTVLYNDQPLTDFKTTKALALLCYLAVTRQVHERATLASLLWGEDAADKARNSLRNALSNLNKLLPDYLDITRESVVFRTASPYWLDIDEFQQLANEMDTPQPNVAHLRAASARYRGDFLTEFFVDGAPEFEAWMLTQREHWRHVALDVLQVQADLAIEARNYADAATTLEKLLTVEPWAEEAHRQLMEVRSRTGDFNAALAQYELCRKALAAEMDVEPMPETTALYERIHVARQGREHNLPADATPFVGRAAELQQLYNLITNPNARLISIVGLGGMGKTRLVLEATRQALQERALLFLNGVCFVPLAGVPTVAALPTAIFDGLGATPSGTTDLQTQLLNYLRNKELLLVLDNFEHLQAGSTLLAQILAECPDVKLLLTGREPLNLPQEWRLDLQGLPYPDEEIGRGEIGSEESVRSVSATSHTASPPTQWEAVDLFVQMAQQVVPGYQLPTADVPHVLRLCQVVAGMPLALKLAASWLRTMPVGRVVNEIMLNLDILSTRLRDLPPRQRSMRVVFDYTWGLLTSEQQQTMATLTIFHGGFSEDAAVSVADATPAILADLVDRWWIQYEITAAGGRYTVHELTRQYCHEHLHDVAESYTQHGQYFGKFVQRCYAQYLHKHYHSAVTDLRQEMANVRAAWQWLVDQIQRGRRIDDALPMLTAFMHPLMWFYRQRGLYVEGRTAYQTACAAIAHALKENALPARTQEQAKLVHAQLQIRLAMFLYFLGDYDGVDNIMATALPIVQAAQMVAEEALALELWARPTRRRGDYARTKELAERSHALYMQAGDELGAMQAIAHLATTAADEGDYALAEELGQQQIAFYRALNDAMNTANWLTNLANTYVRWEKHQAARPLLEEAYAIAEAENNRYLRMFTGCNLSHAARGESDFTRADAYGRESLTLAREMDDQRWIAANLNNLSHNHLALGEWRTAEHYAQAALTITHTIQSEHDALGDLACLARAWAHQGKIEPALRLLFFVEQHPSALRWDKEQLAPLLAELHAELPPAVLAAAATWSTAATLSEVAAYANSLAVQSPGDSDGNTGP